MFVSQYLRKALIASDIFGYPVTLNFQNKTSHRSLLGGILSLITMTIIVLLCYDEAVALFQRQNTKINDKVVLDFEPTNQTINTNDFVFSISVSFDGMLMDEFTKPLFNITMEQMRLAQNSTSYKQSSSAIQFGTCQDSQYQNIVGLSFVKQFHITGTKFSQCPFPNQSIKFSGAYFSKVFEYIKLSVLNCQDSSLCHTADEIAKIVQDNKLTYFKVNLGFSNVQIDLDESTDTAPNLDSSFIITPSSGSLYTTSDVFIERSQFVVDRSIIPYKNDTNTVVFYNSNLRSMRTSLVQTDQTDIIAEVNIKINQHSHQVKKNFSRLDTLVAYVGGILQACVFLLGLIIGNYNKFGFYVELANQLYTFDIVPDYLTRNKTSFSLDEISQRIQDRVERVKKAINGLQMGSKNLLEQQLSHNRLTKLLYKEAQRATMNDIPSNQVAIEYIQQESETLRANQNSNDVSFVPIMFSKESDLIYEISPESDIRLFQSPGVQSVRRSPNRQDKLIVNQLNMERYQKQIEDNMQRESPKIKSLSVRFDLQEEKQSAPLKLEAIISNNLDDEQNQQMEYKNRQDFLQHSFEDILRHHKKIKMIIQYLIHRLLCGRVFKENKNIQLIDKAVEMINHDTDIIKILGKLQDVDKLKKLLLSHNQILLFNYTPRPIVRVQQSIRNKQVKFQEGHKKVGDDAEEKYLLMLKAREDQQLSGKSIFQTLKSHFKLYQSYNHLYHQNGHNIKSSNLKLNKRLMHLIGDDLRDIFEASYNLHDSSSVLTEGHTTLKPLSLVINEQLEEEEEQIQ